jgi:hypothetical protein
MKSIHHFDAVQWDHEPILNPSREGNRQDADECLLGGVGVGRFVESPHDFLARISTLNLGQVRRHLPRCCRQDAGSTLRFVESLDETEIVHCGHEPLAVPRRTQSADESDPLQTLRDCRAAPDQAKRLECGVFTAAYSRQAAIRWRKYRDR